MFIRSMTIAAALSAGIALPVYAQTAAPAPLSPMTPPAPVSGAAPGAPGAASVPAGSASSVAAGDLYYTGTWLPTHWRATEAVGQPVYNRTNERIGEIDELLIDGEGRVLAAVIGVGGFLGMGERSVAVAYKSFQMARDANGKARLVVNLDKAMLEKAPTYKPMNAIKG